MTQPIEELNKKTIGLLKSAQVISSLSSIVKECIENSIDAGATVIVIKLDNFGFKKLEIKDNGSGIKEADISYVAKPHCTSKLRRFEDLGRLSTYGFRGEAISSLCTISNVTIKTKTIESSMGHMFQFDHHGNIISKDPLATNLGTTIIVNNLFKNLPVRKQFYSSVKKRKEELKNVEELIMSYAIIKSNLHISLIHDKQTIFVKPAYDKIEQSFFSVFHDSANKLSSVNENSDELKVQMWLPNKVYVNDNSCSRSSVDRLFIYANNRPIYHKTIEKLIKAYFSNQHSAGSHGKYPIGVLCIEVPSNSIDVNLEPNKTKIIFKDEVSILETLTKLLGKLYGSLEAKNNNLNKVASSLPCTFAGISQEVSEDHISIINHLNNDHQHSLGLSKNIDTSTPMSNDKSLGFNISSLSTIHGSSNSLADCIPPHQDGVFEKQNSSSEIILNSSSVLSKEIFLQTNEILVDEDGVIPKIHYGGCGSENVLDEIICDGKNVDVIGNSSECIVDKLQKPSIKAKFNSTCNKSNNPINYINKEIQYLDVLVDFTDSSSDYKATISNICKPIKSFAKCEEDKPSNEDLLSKDNSVSFGDDCWSRGHVLLENKSIQNVDILTHPSSGIALDKLSSAKCSKRSSNEVSSPRQEVLKKFKKDVSNDSLPFEEIPFRRVESAFSLYAKDVKKKVLEENPGADFTIVAQEIATRWKNADSDIKLDYESRVGVANASSVINKRFAAKLFQKGLTYSLDRYIAPVTPEILKKSNESLLSNSNLAGIKPLQTRLLTYNDSFEDIKSKIQTRKKLFSHSKSSKKECLVGSLKGINGWIFKLNNQICSFNSSRLNEIIIYESLLESFSVPSPDLSPSIPIDDRCLGEDEWKTLMHLSKTGSRSCDGTILLTDARILGNGFRILLFIGNNQDITNGQVVGMVDAISQYGIQDLKFILNALNKNSSLRLKETRPHKLQNWLKREAIRMSKVAPHFRDKTTVMKKLSLWTHLTNNSDKNLAECLHGKLIFTTLVSFDSNSISIK